MSNRSTSFSGKEMAYLQDREFLLFKIEIGKKIERLLGTVEKEIHAVVSDYSLPNEVLSKSGKISKGESYRGLPYYVLDYPRRFGKKDIFSFRTMFWWGNFFSATLHLSGKYLENRRSQLISNIEDIKSSNAFICVNSNPWEYHYERDNYLRVTEISSEQLRSLFTAKPFIKISYQWELDEFAGLPQFVLLRFIQTMDWIFSDSSYMS